MSLLGVKKKHVDASEILKMRNELQAMEINNNLLYNKVQEIKNMKNEIEVLNTNHNLLYDKIENITDRNTICLFAGINGPLKFNQMFNFGPGGSEYVINYPGKILGISLVSLKTGKDGLTVMVSVNDKLTWHGIELYETEYHNYKNFEKPLYVKAGDRISFMSKSDSPLCINTLVPAVIELFL